MPQYVLVAVPSHLASAVAELIATDDLRASQSGEASPTPTDATRLINGWTEEALRAHYRASSHGMRGFLRYLASRAGDEVTSAEAARAVGYADWNGIAGMLGAAQRRAKNHYGMLDGPWDRRWDDNGQARLTMPADVADIVINEAEHIGR
jgi:hypothetical protein